MSFQLPKLRARLNGSGRKEVRRRVGGNGRSAEELIGMTRVHLDQGLLYTQISWGVDGTDSPVSPDVANFVEMYDIEARVPYRTAGIYKLYDRQKKVLALARVNNEQYTDKLEKSEVYVSGKERKHVIKLFEQIRDGKIRPDVEHEEFKQVEGNLNELRRLRREVPRLEGKVASSRNDLQNMSTQLMDVRTQLVAAQSAAARK